MNCLVCGIELQSDKAKTCSPKCRKILSRQESVTSGGVSVTPPSVTKESVTFKFTVKIGENNAPDDAEAKKRVRGAVYWYEVPLSAVPVYQKDWPKLPDFMNGRQYFLWWKNEFAVGDNGEPVILNPLPKHDNLTYYQAGEGSRRWGA